MDGLLHDVVVGVLITLAGAAILGFIAWLWRAWNRSRECVRGMGFEILKLRAEVHSKEANRLLNEVSLDELKEKVADLQQGAVKNGQLTGYRRQVDAKLEGYEGNQAELRNEIEKLRAEVSILTTRLNVLVKVHNEAHVSVAGPEPADRPLTKAETAEALKSLRTGGIESLPGPE